jgi:hypothetical protein
MIHRKFGPACLAIAIAVLVSACGGSSGGNTNAGSTGNGLASKSPRQILAATVAAAESLKSVHIYGMATEGSQTVRLDLQLGSGASGKGTITISGLSMNLVNLNKTFYMQAGKPFWSHFTGGSARAAQVLAGKWIKAPASGTFAGFQKFLNIHALFKQLVNTKHKLTVIKQHSLNGQQVIGLHDQVRGGNLYIAATGKPYPIELTNHGKTAAALSFNDFNQPLTIAAPKGARTIAQLEAELTATPS